MWLITGKSLNFFFLKITLLTIVWLSCIHCLWFFPGCVHSDGSDPRSPTTVSRSRETAAAPAASSPPNRSLPELVRHENRTLVLSTRPARWRSVRRCRGSRRAGGTSQRATCPRTRAPSCSEVSTEPQAVVRAFLQRLFGFSFQRPDGSPSMEFTVCWFLFISLCLRGWNKTAKVYSSVVGIDGRGLALLCRLPTYRRLV